MGALTIDVGLSKGRPWPLGSSHDGAGVNFALFSANATLVELCVFEHGMMRVLPLPECTDQVWHGYLPGATPGLQYAFHVHGQDVSGIASIRNACCLILTLAS